MLSSVKTSNKNDVNNSSESFSRNEHGPILSNSYNRGLFSRQFDDKLHKSIHQEYIIIAEYKMLLSENIEGVYVIPSKENPLVWIGVIFVRNGFYEDGIFRFNILLSENYPDGGHPKVVFLSEILHPVISSTTNELHLLDGFPNWNRNEQHIWQVVKYVHWIFHNFNASIAHTINHEAANLYRNSEEHFLQRVKNCIILSQQQITETPSSSEDNHYFNIDNNIMENYEATKESMLNYGSQEKMSINGCSWVAPGSYKPLSQKPSHDTDNQN